MKKQNKAKEELQNKINSIEYDIDRLEEYVFMKIGDGDWHAVADAAMDMQLKLFEVKQIKEMISFGN